MFDNQFENHFNKGKKETFKNPTFGRKKKKKECYDRRAAAGARDNTGPQATQDAGAQGCTARRTHAHGAERRTGAQRKGRTHAGLHGTRGFTARRTARARTRWACKTDRLSCFHLIFSRLHLLNALLFFLILFSTVSTRILVCFICISDSAFVSPSPGL